MKNNISSFWMATLYMFWQVRVFKDHFRYKFWNFSQIEKLIQQGYAMSLFYKYTSKYDKMYVKEYLRVHFDNMEKNQDCLSFHRD